MNIKKMAKPSESGAPLLLLTALLLICNSVEIHAMTGIAKWPGRAKISGSVGMILANANPAARNTIMQFLNSLTLGDMRTSLPGLIDATRADAKARAWIAVEESGAVRAKSADSYFQVMGRQFGDFVEQMTAAEKDGAAQVEIAQKLSMLHAAIEDSNAPSKALEELQRTKDAVNTSLSEAKQAEFAAGIRRVAENFGLKSDSDFFGNPVGAVLASALSLNGKAEIPLEGRLRPAGRNVENSATVPAVDQRPSLTGPKESQGRSMFQSWVAANTNAKALLGWLASAIVLVGGFTLMEYPLLGVAAFVVLFAAISVRAWGAKTVADKARPAGLAVMRLGVWLAFAGVLSVMIAALGAPVSFAVVGAVVLTLLGAMMNKIWGKDLLPMLVKGKGGAPSGIQKCNRYLILRKKYSAPFQPFLQDD